MAKTQFSLIKKKIGRPEYSLTPYPLRPIVSQFCLTPPPNPPNPLFKVDVIRVSPLKTFDWLLMLISSCYHTVLSAIWKIFLSFSYFATYFTSL